MNAQPHVVVAGAFDDIRSRDLRFLEAAAGLGPVTVLLPTDMAIRTETGHPPRFSFAERAYVLSALRHVSQVVPVASSADAPPPDMAVDIWAATQNNPSEVGQRYCHDHALPYHEFPEESLQGFPLQPPAPTGRRKVLVTGCFDWFHSGHVRFFEEASAFGDLFVVVGHDANIRLLKGEHHPLLSAEERRYIVGSVRFVTQALISSGTGWLDAEPEIRQLKPDVYVVNEDGDKPDKRDYCRELGIEYVILRRAPAPGLPRRSSTELRGF